MEKKCWFASFWALFVLRFISDIYIFFLYQTVRGFAFHQCKFYFDSMYGGLDTSYGSNNMKINKDPWMSDHLKTIDDHLEA